MKLSRHVGWVALAASLAVISGAALAGSDETYVPELGLTVPNEKVQAVRNSLAPGGRESTVRAPAPVTGPDAISARLLDRDVPVPLSPALVRTTNGWLVSNGKTLVAVYAGAAGEDAEMARFVVVRQNLSTGGQRQDVVDAGKIGAVTITEAPLGASVETSGQVGDLVFHSARGHRGVLHLRDDTVDLAK